MEIVSTRYDVESTRRLGILSTHVLCHEHAHLRDALQSFHDRQQESWQSVALIPREAWMTLALDPPAADEPQGEGTMNDTPPMPDWLGQKVQLRRGIASPGESLLLPGAVLEVWGVHPDGLHLVYVEACTDCQLKQRHHFWDVPVRDVRLVEATPPKEGAAYE